jgi:shikimate dehydrogenase
MSHTDRYAVMGNPIAHSKSPRIHTLFALQTGQDISYEAILVEPGQFTMALEEFRKSGGKGLNITVPFKQDAWNAVDDHSPGAKLAGAVNTIIFKDDDSLFGENTDGTGLVSDLTNNNQVTLKGKSILVLGAGGAVRGVLKPLLDQKPAKLVIANRTVSRAEELADIFSEFGSVEACGFEALAGQQFDLVINGTAASLQRLLPPLPDKILASEACCYDMMYGDKPTLFMEWGEKQGAALCLDGLGMLVEQAAESFYLWRGVRPETRAVINALRTELSA